VNIKNKGNRDFLFMVTFIIFFFRLKIIIFVRIIIGDKMQAKPFIQWAGGKRRLLNQIRMHYPIELHTGEIDKYIEPFVGGGAVFFDVMQNFNIKSAYISDVNKDLIMAYKVVQQKPEQLCDYLEQVQREYLEITKDKKAYFLMVREQYNNERFEIDYKHFNDKWIKRTSQFMFLVKYSYNSLCEYNSKGGFNVPFGRKENMKLYNRENILAVSRLLQNVEIRLANYSECYNEVTSNSFVYLDPPYRPITKAAHRKLYTEIVFTDEDQKKLSDFFRRLDTEKNAKLMLSNSDPKNTNPNDNFFETIYEGYNIHRIETYRLICPDVTKRGKVTELLITNYKQKPNQLYSFL